MPGNVVPALLCAGWVASRTPLRERLTGEEPVATARPAIALRAATASLIVVIGLVAAWAALQPVRSLNAQDAAYDRLERGELPQAAAIAQIAHERDPLALEPLFDIAAFAEARGDLRAAERALDQAIELEPATYETWRRLGAFRLVVQNDPRGALEAYRTAYYLNPQSARATSDLLTAARIINGG